MNAVEFSDLSPCLLLYDVPTGSGVANPSGRLRRIAFRINLSAWVVRRPDLPYSYLNSLAARGVKWRVVSFDPSEAGTLVQMGIENIRQEIASAVARSRKADRRASRNRDKNDAKSDIDYAVACRLNVRRLRKLLDDMEHAAARFGITAGQLSLAEARSAVDAIDAGMKGQCAAYAAMAKVARKSRASGSRAMASAIEQDQVPAGIAADWCEENGGNVGTQVANKVRFIFNGK